MRNSTVGEPSDSKPLVVWLGDRPGIVEGRKQETWVGEAGKLLRAGYLPDLPDAHHFLTNILDEFTSGKPPSSAYTKRHPVILDLLRSLADTPASDRILVVMGAEPSRFVHHIDNSLPGGITKGLNHQLKTITIDGTVWTLVYTYNPAHVLEVPNLARAADNHLNLLKLYMRGIVPRRTKPDMRPPRVPRPEDPTTLILDIETYGAVYQFDDGTPAPSQKDTNENGRFHPARSIYEDRPKRLVCTVAITLPIAETADPKDLLLWDGTFPHSRDTLAQLRPGETIVLNLERSAHRLLLGKWLRHAETIIGHNVMFDLQYLLFGEPLARAALPPFSKHIIDTVHLAYLEDETRPEKSLKSLGPLLGLFRYTETLEHTRYRGSGDRGLHRYNAEDTHNTTLLACTLASMIRASWPTISKGDHECLAFYSRTMWSVLGMLEHGVAFSIPHLLELEAEFKGVLERTYAHCLDGGVQISGTGSQASCRTFISDIAENVEYEDGDIKTNLLNHPLFQLTEKRKDISIGILNLKLCQFYLDPDDPRHEILRQWIEHLSTRKIMSSYLTPLLYASNKTLKHASGDRSKVNRTATLIPEIKPCTPCRLPSPYSSSSSSSGQDSETSPLGPPFTKVGIAYPRVYITPSSVTDSSDDEGGTEQMRLAFKGPSLPTIPPSIQKAQTCRHPDSVVWASDLSQIEMRVPAVLSGEPKLIRNFAEGGDLHTDRAINIFGEHFLLNMLNQPTDHIITKETPGFDEYRQVGKVGNFSDQFWATAETMQRSVFKDQMQYIPIESFRKAVDSRPTNMPALYAWQKGLQKEATERGFLDVPILGLSRHFVGGSDYHLNKILNFRVQAIAAAVLIDIQQRLSFMWDRTKPWLMTYQVYDAVKGECRRDGVDILKADIATAVHECSTRGVWGQMQKLYGREVELAYDFEIKEPA